MNLFKVIDKKIGKKARISVAVVLLLFGLFAAYQTYELLLSSESLKVKLFDFAGLEVNWAHLIAAGVFLVVAFIVFRLVNSPKIVKFLSETETEVSKISWPKRRQVLQATVVVIVSVIFLALFFYVTDLVLFRVLQLIGYYS